MDSKAAKKVAEFLQSKLKDSGDIDVAIVCGSGLSHLSEALEKPIHIKYADIPGFPVPSVAGHKAELVFGFFGKKRVVCMRGRFHTYEGYDIQRTALPIAAFKYLGVKILVVTNASGGLNPEYEVGDFMVIQDHLNLPGLAGKHPLVGENDKELGPRFPAMSDCYYGPLRRFALQVGSRLGLGNRMRTGTYVFVSGPSYETGAESHFLYNSGADAVGMSTVPETLVAHYCGLKVLGVSLITNKSVIDPDNSKVATHEEVLGATGGENQEKMQMLIKTIIKDFDIDTKEQIPPTAIQSRAGISQRVKSMEKTIKSLKRMVGVLSVGFVALLGLQAFQRMKKRS